VDYELYNRRDIEAALGDRAWVISQKDASIRNFGFLVGSGSSCVFFFFLFFSFRFLLFSTEMSPGDTSCKQL